MMAVLFMVGQNAEDPSIVEEMLDIQKYPRKPKYYISKIFFLKNALN